MWLLLWDKCGKHWPTKYDFWKVIFERWTPYSQVSPIIFMKVFLSFVLLSENFILYLPLIAIWSHLGVLFLFHLYQVLITHLHLQFSYYFKSLSFHTCSVTAVSSSMLISSFSYLFGPFSAWNAFLHNFAHCTLFLPQELEHHFLISLL